ncbi:MAG: hypothetical protein QOE33_2929 [Acidobacteriota bacterium]|nr:hypothetical protein [Acidobacteriota bacterium]
MNFVTEDLDVSVDPNLVHRFQQILESPGSEEDIQQFLTQNQLILGKAFIHMVGFVIPKFKFGTEYVSDFLIGRWSQAWIFTLIELETKEAKIFNKDGTPARRLSQAIKQLAEWGQWIKSHESYFKERLQPHIESLISTFPPESRYSRFANVLRHDDHIRITYVAILGRRDDSFPDVQKRRAAFYELTGNNIEILSYDWLLDLIDAGRADR